MNLYSVTLKESNAITHVSYGNFFGTKSQDIAKVKASQILEIWTQDLVSTKISLALKINTFSQIRNIQTYRPVGSKQDSLMIISDSGFLTVLSFNKSEENEYSYKRIIQEKISKTGCRRISLGAYLAKDPKGRAVMLASIEQNKTVYLTEVKEDKNSYRLSSPLEANSPTSIVFDLIGIDTGYEDIVFASLESNYGELDDPESIINTGIKTKDLVFFNVNLGLNNVVKSGSVKVDNSANMLLTFTDEDPVIVVVEENKFTVYDIQSNQLSSLDFFQRIDMQSNRCPFIVKSFYKHKKVVFYLLQNERGDVFKLTYQDKSLQLDYLFTSYILTGVTLLKTGFIFFAFQNTDHVFYKIKQEGGLESLPDNRFDNYFIPHSIIKKNGFEFKQLFENQSGLVDFKYNDLIGDEIGQFYVLNSSYDLNHLKVLKNSVDITELANSGLPLQPNNVWTLNRIDSSIDSDTDFILLSAEDRSFLLKAGTQIEAEKENMGFVLDKKTIGFMSLYHKEIVVANVQITQNQIRIIKKDKLVRDWNADGTIIKVCYNENNLVIILSNNSVCHFRQNYSELVEINRINLNDSVKCCSIVKSGNSDFLCLGFAGKVLKVYSLEQDKGLIRLSTSILSALPIDTVSLEGVLLVSLTDGKVIRFKVDDLTGGLSETQLIKFNEQNAARLFKVKENVIIRSKKNLLYSKSGDTFKLRHLQDSSNTLMIKAIDSLKNSQSTNGLIIITKDNMMKICNLNLDETNNSFSSKKLKLDYIGRQVLVQPELMNLIVSESQNRTYNKDSFNEQYNKMIQTHDYLQKEEICEGIESGLLRFEPDHLKWVSKVRLVDPFSLKELDCLDFTSTNNQRILKMQLVNFKEFENKLFLLVSIVEDHDQLNNTFSASYINIYGFDHSESKFLFVNQTQLDDLCFSFFGYKGRLLAAVGGYLRLYELGKKSLLKKSEYKKRFRLINNIRVVNSRIFISDATDSVHMLRFNDKTSQFQQIADDILPRYITAFELIDYHTVVVTDKFGNMTVLRIPQNAEEEYSEDFATYKFRWESGYLNGAPVKFVQACNFYNINTVTSIQKVRLYFSQNDVIFYCNIEGAICALLPFEFKSDLDFFKHLELYSRVKEKGVDFVTGRDHLLFRGYYSAVKGVIDGDLCEMYGELKQPNKQFIADNLERKIEEVLTKVEDMRHKLL